MMPGDKIDNCDLNLTRDTLIVIKPLASRSLFSFKIDKNERFSGLFLTAMYLLNRPREAQLRDFLAQQSQLSFSYQQVGATHLQVYRVPAYLPKGYVVDHCRFRLGTGSATFARAKEALKAWSMFAIDWVRLFPTRAAIREGSVMAILARGPGIWSLNAVRIVYVLEEIGTIERYGFACGTLPDHAGQGEERFAVEWHHTDDSVWYDLLAFSRPNQRLSYLGYPYMRGLQRRFAVASYQAMHRTVIQLGL